MNGDIFGWVSIIASLMLINGINGRRRLLGGLWQAMLGFAFGSASIRQSCRGALASVASVISHTYCKASVASQEGHESDSKSKETPDDISVPLYNINKEKIGSVELGRDVFGVPVRKDILHEVVRWQRAKKQQGTHKTKTRGEVSGGGRKPWVQKGTGRARAGDIRPPHWRGGGVAHGPVPRSHEYKINKKLKRLGLKCALSAKTKEERLLVVDSIKLEDGKTRALDEHLKALLEGTPRRSVLMIDSGKTASDGGALLRQAAGNLAGVDVLPVEGINVYSILERDILLLTQGAMGLVTERLRRPIKR